MAMPDEWRHSEGGQHGSETVAAHLGGMQCILQAARSQPGNLQRGCQGSQAESAVCWTSIVLAILKLTSLAAGAVKLAQPAHGGDCHCKHATLLPAG